ncbi:SMI1/KNR4 family protein [bacterium 1XD8-76]|nr:SMI1/KNR4 family protein [bacterium 1XD8-76]
MFLKKEKPKFEVRPLYSISEELELIREFCWQPKLEAGKIYTEEEINAVEQRLNYKLPQPLRELYLVLGDYACEKKDTYFCRPEELHWSGGYLLVEAMERTNRGLGIYRKDPYASVYEWRRSEVNIYGEEQEKKPKSEVIRNSARNQYFSKQCFYWDIVIIQHVLNKVMRDWWDLHQTQMTEELSPFYIGCSLPKKLDELRKVRQRMEEWLLPISSKAELLRVDIFGKNVGPEDYVVYAYTNPEKNLLVLSFSAQQKYGLITKEPVPYSFAEQVEEKTGMLFWSWNGQGRERMEEKEKEMQAAGLFQR